MLDEAYLPCTAITKDRAADAAAEREPGHATAPPPGRIALARLYGEPLFALPSDLYIPPDALEVILEAFEGRWTCCST